MKNLFGTWLRKSILLLMCISLGSIYGQTFTPTAGPEGGAANRIAIDSKGVLFAGTRSGMFRSTDDGISWEKINNGFGSTFTTSIVVGDSDYVFVGTTNRGIYRTRDGGESWENFASGFSVVNVQALYVTNSNELIAGFDGGGVYRSSDNGETWTEFNNGMSDMRVFAVSMANNGDLYYGTIRTGVYRFAVNDTIWRPLFEGRSNQRCTWLAAYGDDGMLSGTGSNVDYIASGDSTWTKFAPNTNLTGFVSSVFVSEKGQVYVATLNGFLSHDSANGTLDWKNIGLTNTRTNEIVSNSNGRIFLATDAGVFYSDDEGENWQVGVEGFITSRITSFLNLPNGDVLTGTESNGVFKSSDGGLSWEQSIGGLTYLSVRKMTIDRDGVIYAGVAGTGGVYRSENNGELWQRVNNGLRVNSVSAMTSRFGVVYTCINNQPVQYSMDKGENWHALPEDSLTDKRYRTVLVLPDTSLLVGTWNEGVFHLAKGDSIWTKRNDGLPAYRMTSLLEDKDGNIVAGVNDGGVFISKDHGLTWEPTPTEIPDKTVNTLLISQDDEIFATSWNEIFFTNDGGQEWHVLNEGIDSFINDIIVSADRQIYVGTAGNGVYSATLLPTDVETQLVSVPNEFSLNQNYPNPFNPATTISFKVNKPTQVKLAIYNLLGAKIKTLIEGQVESGSHSVMWNGRDQFGQNVASGQYFYKLQAGDQQVIKSMVLLK